MNGTIKNPDKEQLFRKWVNDYSDLLYRYCVKHLPDENLGRDLVQETFLSAWRNMDTFKGEASVKNWLFVILRSKVIDHFRKSNANKDAQLIYLDHNDSVFFDEEDHWQKGFYPRQWSVDFSNTAETKEFYHVFESCGKKLKQIQNSVFIMKYVDGLKSEEICKLLNITPSNYWVLIHRAKVQLRACIEKNWMFK